MNEQKNDPEKSVLDYLYEYGNTRENDLLGIIRNDCDYSLRGCKKVLTRLEDKKKIFRVVHGKLRPPAVYFSLKEHMPLEIQKALIQARANMASANLAAQAQIESAKEAAFIKSIYRESE